MNCKNQAAGVPPVSRWSKLRLRVAMSRTFTLGLDRATGLRMTRPRPKMAYSGVLMIGVKSTPMISATGRMTGYRTGLSHRGRALVDPGHKLPSSLLFPASFSPRHQCGLCAQHLALDDKLGVHIHGRHQALLLRSSSDIGNKLPHHIPTERIVIPG